MRAAQKLYKDGVFIKETGDHLTGKGAILVLGFGSKNILLEDDIYNKLKITYPGANILLCSTAGEIYNNVVYDDTVSIVVMEFEETLIKTSNLNINYGPDSFDAGKALFNDLNTEELSYMMIISDGGLVNGSELVRGIESINKGKIPVSGGLAGDGDKFNYTVVGCNEDPAMGNIAAIGFYGKSLKIGHGSLGGWETFGPEKKVTRSVSNRLFEIDGKSALELYKQYLGKYADDLPGSALLFPLYVRLEGSRSSVVRTILSIDDKEQCMVFAGDIPEGSYVSFMKANFDKLIDAATHAASNTLTQFRHGDAQKPKLALLISCVGRKLILGNRIDEEIEAVKEIFGDSTLLSGFYSYGEISPLGINTKCKLHNQTMTITTFDEETISNSSS
jgi:hypothetical protein